MIPIRLLAVLCFFAASAPLRAQDAAAGADVARKHCSGCHQTQEQPRPILGFAPAFVKIADTKGMTQTSIEVFLKTPHEVMPNYVLSEREISDVAAYIASLRSKASPRHK
jgi:mono/diheme cytochrome c family protein